MSRLKDWLGSATIINNLVMVERSWQEINNVFGGKTKREAERCRTIISKRIEILIKKSMIKLLDECIDPTTNEVNATKLAEMAADDLGIADEGGPLDDPDHDIWVWAFEVASEGAPDRL